MRHVGRLLDTHEMVMREASLRKKAELDGLTGVFNREAAMTRIELAQNEIGGLGGAPEAGIEIAEDLADLILAVDVENCH